MKITGMILATSLALWTWRSVDYALAGSFAPMLLLGGVTTVLSWAWFSGARAWRCSVRCWGAMLVLVGLGRVALFALLTLDPGISLHGYEALTPGYLVGTLFHLVAGTWLLARPGDRNEQG